jgi:beta-phosphoglucomutase
MKKAFIFDMDGTLCDNIPYHEVAWMQFLKNNKIDVSLEEMRVKMQGTGFDSMPRFFGQLTDNQILTFISEKENLYHELYRPHLKYRPGLVDFLEKARAKGIEIGLGTAADRSNVDFTLDGLGIRHFFEKIISMEDVSRGKPDPEVFLKCAEGLGVLPENCLVFEDSATGLEAAMRAKMASIAVSTDGVFENLERFPNCIRVISDFRSFEALIWK